MNLLDNDMEIIPPRQYRATPHFSAVGRVSKERRVATFMHLRPIFIPTGKCITL
jgi:hypothetical protein